MNKTEWYILLGIWSALLLITVPFIEWTGPNSNLWWQIPIVVAWCGFPAIVNHYSMRWALGSSFKPNDASNIKENV